MASKIIRSGNSPLLNLIRHLRLSPSITPTPAAAVVYNRNYLFPPTVVPRVESNQAVVKSPKGDQFAVWAFNGLGHQSGVNVHCGPPNWDDDNNFTDSDLADSDSVIDDDLVDCSDWSDGDVE